MLRFKRTLDTFAEGRKKMAFDGFLEVPPYGLDKNQKSEMLLKRFQELTDFHRENCGDYSRILSAWKIPHRFSSYYEIPFLPVRLFKELELMSIGDEEIFKTMTSSGTTGQAVSKIYLNRMTSVNQQKALVKIVSDFTGKGRLPMLIIDSPSVVKDRAMFSARGAGILGFSIFASEKKYALDENMQLDIDGMKEFLEKHKGKRILLFGFTFMIWQYFYKELRKMPGCIDLSNGILIHGGGWKKLINEAVEPQEFGESLRTVCGLDDVHDYYGMVEQTGCIYMQCECGHLHASIFSDVIIRDMRDFSICEVGQPGVIQVLSAIPESYPGHSILTEDEGVLLGEDDCPCGRKGKYFKVLGRIKNAEVRGCSDTYEKN